MAHAKSPTPYARPYSLISHDDQSVATLLDTALDILIRKAVWTHMQTRSGAARKYEQWTFADGNNCPSHLIEVAPLIEVLLAEAQRHAPGAIRPLQCFMCLYEQATDACPAHSHDCRQLTLSLGSERTMQVGRHRVVLRHGSVLVLNGERHAILPADRPSGPRVSINLFYTVASEPHASVNTGVPPVHPTPPQNALALPTTSSTNLPIPSAPLRTEELLTAHSISVADPARAPISVCVIGGGPAGLGCCRQLCSAPGVHVTMVVEGRGIGGRMCTKVLLRRL